MKFVSSVLLVLFLVLQWNLEAFSKPLMFVNDNEDMVAVGSLRRESRDVTSYSIDREPKVKRDEKKHHKNTSGWDNQFLMD